MTNFERWQAYTSGLSSPQNYIDWSYRYLIAASLQRRVWCGPEGQECFPNMYVIPVGNPGIGKGLVIREVSAFLRHWKLKDAIKITANEISQDQKITIEAAKELELKRANEEEMQCKNAQNSPIEPLLIPIAADATTYEALVQAVAASYRFINYIKNGADKPTLGYYGHSSICFCLQELGSLLRKRTDDTVNYMLGLYDCPLDYEYITKTNGKDRVRRGCLNLLAGTTPGFMQSIFNEDLVNEGFSSRVFFIYASRNRKNQFWIPARTAEQKEHKAILLDHIRKLTALYGKVIIDDETKKFLEEWWDDLCSSLSKRINQSPKLIPYYARKNIHVMKVAMAEHFSENTSMSIPLETFKKAIRILDDEEKNMHLAITMEAKNPLSTLAKKILEMLEGKDMNLVELTADTWEMCPTSNALKDALSFLIETNQVITVQITEEMTERQAIMYKIKR